MFHCILFFPTSHISGWTEGSIAAVSLRSDSISICCTYTDHLPQGETTEWWSWWILLSQLQGGAWGLSDSGSEINASGRGGKRISFPECLALNADEKFCPYSANVAFLQHIQWWDQAISGRSKFYIFTLQAYEECSKPLSTGGTKTSQLIYSHSVKCTDINIHRMVFAPGQPHAGCCETQASQVPCPDLLASVPRLTGQCLFHMGIGEI